MATTYDVGRAFKERRRASGSSVHSEGDLLFSYGTAVAQRLPSGLTIGNVTRYSVTTSKHQSQMGVRQADILVEDVPRGATDLQPYMKKKGGDSYGGIL